MSIEINPVRHISMQEMDNSNSSQDQKLAQPLLPRDNQVCQPKQNKVQFPPRKIQYKNSHFSVQPKNTQSNIIRNQKYSILTFIPLVLFNQFKYFFNFFYLAIAISQFIPPLQVGLLFSYVAPLALVLILTMMKQAYDDFKRYLKDLQANSTVYNVLTNNGLSPTKSKDLKVGNIVEVHANQRIPADMVILYTNDKDGSVFIRTDQLDGQTDWKLRKPSRLTQTWCNEKFFERIIFQQFSVEAMQPIVNIYKFQGITSMGQDKQGLELENSAWADSVLASGKIFGMVVYGGKQMRMALNSRSARSKFGEVDMQLNRLSKLLFLSMVLISLILVLLKGFTFDSIDSVFNQFMLFFRYILLLASIIPISMRVNLDFAKLIYSYKINQDQQIKGTLVRNSNIPQQLGRIQFLLTDKTGTLTQNDMIFKKLSLEAQAYSNDQFLILKHTARQQLKFSRGPLFDVHERFQKQNKKKSYRRAKQKVLLDLLFALAICHNVTPVIDDDGNRILQASSPDEVALVKLAQSLGLVLRSRSQNRMCLVHQNKEYAFCILAIFPFSSQAKRMGIIVRDQQSQRYILYLKGADSEMKNKMNQTQRGFMLDECEQLAREGLRTMVITQKYLTEDEYLDFAQKQKHVKSLLKNRQEAEKNLREKLESNVQFLAVTGVQDKLQENVAETLQSIRNAGISVWMLTGDKIQTAKCIAISTGIKSVTHQMHVISDVSNAQDLRVKLQQFSKIPNCLLIVDGTTLKLALQDLRTHFFDRACLAPAVICARCSPTQKAQVVQSIKQITNKKTCAIGDGGNDVAMIQAADVGVGVQGKEGVQAALASDFSIPIFRYLRELLLWHGRLSYKRSCVLSQFIIHRGMIISVMQAIFIVCFYFIALPIYDGFLMLGYSTVFTSLPVFSLVFDEDIDKEAAIEFPELYKSLQKGRQLNTKTFVMWIWVSIFQGFIIMVTAFLFFQNDSFYMLATITFSSLIVIEYLNIFTSIHTPHKIMLLSIILSLLIYLAVLFLLKSYLNVSKMDLLFLAKITGISLATWLPPFSFFKLFRYFNPSDFDKVMQNRASNKR